MDFPSLKITKLNNTQLIKFSSSIRQRAVIAYLFEGSTHRDIERDILVGVDTGFGAMAILHHYGLIDVHKGFFVGKKIQEAIEILKNSKVLNADDLINLLSIESTGKELGVKGNTDTLGNWVDFVLYKTDNDKTEELLLKLKAEIGNDFSVRWADELKSINVYGTGEQKNITYTRLRVSDDITIYNPNNNNDRKHKCSETLKRMVKLTEENIDRFIDILIKAKAVIEIIPNIDNDSIGTSRDSLNINKEVQMFAKLVASRNTSLPLSIGLFGNWGSGKSFFMNGIINFIDNSIPKVKEENKEEIVEKSRDYCSKIINIKFNAWHYVDSNLWANLANVILNELAEKFKSSEHKSNIYSNLKSYNELKNKTETLAVLKIELEQEIEEIKKNSTIPVYIAKMINDSSFLKDSMMSLNKYFETNEMKKARKTLVREIVNEPEYAKKLISVLEGIGENQELSRLISRIKDYQSLKGQDGDKILEEIDSLIKDELFILIVMTLRKEIKRVNQYIKKGKILGFWKRYVKKETIILVATAIASVFALLVNLGGISFLAKHLLGISNKVEAASVQIASVIPFIGLAANYIVKFYKISEPFRKYVNKEDRLMEEKRMTLETKVKSINNDVSKMSEILLEIENGDAIKYYLTERLESGDYKNELGLMNTIRSDFEAIDRYLDNMDSGKDYRVIIYIDDLDRCPQDKVVQVLEAIHLLLAFKFFAVIVAVDTRWISECLSKKYQGLFREAGSEDRATTFDYLEKIFLIPFWIKPVGVEDIRNLFGDLLNVNKDEFQIEHELTEGNEAALSQLKYLNPPEIPSIRESRNINKVIQNLEITSEESKIIMDTAEILVGCTPRTLKRYINIYKLIKAKEGMLSDAESRGTLLLLGIMIGVQSLYIQIREYKTKFNGNIIEFIDELAPNALDCDKQQIARVKLVVNKNGFRNMKAEHIQNRIIEVSRFSFGNPEFSIDDLNVV